MLRIPKVVLDEISRQMRQAYPHEGCGVLIGRRSPEGTIAVVEAVSATNINTDRAEDRFEMNPADQLVALRRATAMDADVVGCYHSHPNRPAVPSPIDRRRAIDVMNFCDGWAYLIVGVRRMRADEGWNVAPRAYVLDPDNGEFREVLMACGKR